MFEKIKGTKEIPWKQCGNNQNQMSCSIQCKAWEIATLLSKDICFGFPDISGKMKNILDDNWQSNLLTIQYLYKANDDFYGNLQTEICLCMYKMIGNVWLGWSTCPLAFGCIKGFISRWERNNCLPSSANSWKFFHSKYRLGQQ